MLNQNKFAISYADDTFKVRQINCPDPEQPSNYNANVPCDGETAMTTGKILMVKLNPDLEMKEFLTYWDATSFSDSFNYDEAKEFDIYLGKSRNS